MKAPDNKGERRENLVILEKVNWIDGLLNDVVSDPKVSEPARYKFTLLTLVFW